MRLRDYERPEGWVPGSPEVLVAPKPIEQLGMPEVNYDSLHQFFTDNLEIPYDQKTSVRLYGRTPNSPLLGFHVPYTRTIHVNAPAAENRYAGSGGTMRVVAHEARHRSDSTNRKALTAVEVGARYASFKLGYEIVHALPYVWPLAFYGGFKARQIWYKHEPAEKRARAEEAPATWDHRGDILFPISARAIMERREEVFRQSMLEEEVDKHGGEIALGLSGIVPAPEDEEQKWID